MLQPTLTPKQEAAYLEHYGRCPRCHSDQMDGDSLEVELNTVTQEMTCLNCGFIWTDVYTLSAAWTHYDREETIEPFTRQEG